jgi:hypothetical protein
MTFDEFWKNERMVATSYRNAAKAAWNEARRTDPAKAQMLEALKDLLVEAKYLYQYYPNFRQTAEEYFADEIKIIKAAEEE